MNEVLYKYSGIPHIIKTDTQGCGAGLADAKLCPFIDNSHSLIQKLKTKQK